MNWIAPSANDADTDALEKRLWDAADQFRANSGLKAQEYSAPVLGLIFLRFAEVRCAAQRAKLEKAGASSRRESRVDDPKAYHVDGILYLPAEARFDHLLKGDVTVAKNYLREKEIGKLNRLVVMFLDFAEDQARRRKQIFLQNWLTRLHDLLNLNERAILTDPGNVSRETAHQRAGDKYERFAARRRAELEAQGETDLLNLLDAEVKKLPRQKKGGKK